MSTYYIKAPNKYVSYARSPHSYAGHCQRCGGEIRSVKKGDDGVLICIKCYEELTGKKV